jgi:hypothetical protein
LLPQISGISAGLSRWCAWPPPLFGFVSDSGLSQHTKNARQFATRLNNFTPELGSLSKGRAFIARIIKGNSMRFGLNFTVKAIIISGLLTHGAAAQTSSQAGGQPVSQSAGDTSRPVQAGSATDMANAAVPPVWLNAGTLAETAETTALATSTYHQPTGFLPGMKP